MRDLGAVLVDPGERQRGGHGCGTGALWDIPASEGLDDPPDTDPAVQMPPRHAQTRVHQPPIGGKLLITITMVPLEWLNKRNAIHVHGTEFQNKITSISLRIY